MQLAFALENGRDGTPQNAKSQNHIYTECSDNTRAEVALQGNIQGCHLPSNTVLGHFI